MLQHSRKRTDSLGLVRTGNTLGWLAYNRVLQQKFDEAEPLIRETVATFAKEEPDGVRRFYWVSVFGEVLLGQRKYAEAEPFILGGYDGMKQRETNVIANQRPRLVEAGERVVRFYEATNQPEKARAWREKLKPRPLAAMPDGVKALAESPGPPGGSESRR